MIWDAYSVVLGCATNDYAGDTVIGAADTLGFGSTAIVQLGADNALPFGAGKGNIAFGFTAGKSDLLELNGHNAQVNGLVAPDNTNAVVDNRSGSGTYTLTVGSGNTTSVFGGVIVNTSGKIVVAKTGAGTLALSQTNSYSGGTFVNADTLALSGFASISSSAIIVIGGNAVLDVSGLTNTFTLGASQTLSNSAAATGIISGNFNDAFGTNCFSFADGTPSLLITNGVFALAATSVLKIFNPGPAFLPGSMAIRLAGDFGHDAKMPRCDAI